ncbi:PP2C family protein-serine/threonine phosphatase [Jatrophihabitans sp.]|uniref:PP2C family protein-serine/threonine phosphatase n=1 Tax=Jatrophihabitans sp. TaxID=1932789 RepID=UPI0030C7031D|nr:serine/threonine-protein phosphatase [Jatrophihabitans sp.]
MPDRDQRSIGRLLLSQQNAAPDAIVETLMVATAPVGATDLVLYLIDYEHTVLMPHPDVLPHGQRPEVATVDGSMAGRAFQSATVLAAQRDGAWQVWVPVRERANKLGVLALTVPVFDEGVEDFCTELGNAAAYLVMASAHYTDLPHLMRRHKDMDLAAEMQWSLLPPLSFSSAGTTIAGLLEPAYEVGGDCFDYALNAGTLDIAMFDAMGHGLTSSVLASLVVGAYRHARRDGQTLAEIAISTDAATRTFPGPPTFATALLARLRLDTGHLTWLSCGHPQPIIVRSGHTLAPVDAAPGVPIGLGALGSVTGTLVEASLEPGDGILIYTDGVTDAQDPDGEYFGEERLRDLLGREHQSGGPPQEVIRRLVRSALDHAQVRLRDDATMLYIRWNADTDRD